MTNMACIDVLYLFYVIIRPLSIYIYKTALYTIQTTDVLYLRFPFLHVFRLQKA